MNYQNDPTKPDYNPSPQERFRFSYNLKFSTCNFISIVISNFVSLVAKNHFWSTGKFGIWVCAGVASVLLIYGVFNFVRFWTLKKDPESLEKLYRQYTDERNILIREKTSGGSFMATVFIICIAIMIFSYISIMVTLVLAGLLVVMLLVRLLLKIYYEKKY